MRQFVTVCIAVGIFELIYSIVGFEHALLVGLALIAAQNTERLYRK